MKHYRQESPYLVYQYIVMKVVFFHGLESEGPGGKAAYIEYIGNNVFADKMNYRDPRFLERIWKEVEEFGPDYVVGSSMGGWFGLHMAVHLNVPCMLFNPAVVNRTVEITLPPLGDARPEVDLLLGKTDDVVIGHDVVNWMNNREFPICVTWADCGHRVPPEVYGPWLDEVFGLY